MVTCQPGAPKWAGTTGRSAEVVGLGVGGGHLLAVLHEAPGPDGGDAAVVEVPAAAAGRPDRVAGGLEAGLLEGVGGLVGGADLAPPVAEVLEQLHHVAQLELGHL